jgi:hypothetical protein
LERCSATKAHRYGEKRAIPCVNRVNVWQVLYRKTHRIVHRNAHMWLICGHVANMQVR